MSAKRLAVDSDHITARIGRFAERGNPTVDGNPPGADQHLGLPP
jgi:hypothetical protein